MCSLRRVNVLKNYQADNIDNVIEEPIGEKSIVFSDKSTSYIDIADFVELHVTEKSDKETTKETLRRVHITISNAKRNLPGNDHKIKGKYLQLYLNKFVCKLNRRHFGDKIPDRPVIANITEL